MSIFYERTPTIFCDLSKTVNGTGTVGDPYQYSQLSGVVSGDMSGQTLGLKRGSRRNGGFVLSGFYATSANPFFIVPYGDGARPIISGAVVRSDFMQVAGDSRLWYRSGYGAEPEVFDTSNLYQSYGVWRGERLWKVPYDASLANLIAAGPGSATYNNGTLYIYPYNGNPNLGQVECAESISLCSLAPFQAANGAGNLVIAGIHVRNSKSQALLVSVATYAGASAVGPIDIVDCIAGSCGLNDTAGTAVGVCFNVVGGSNTKRITSGHIANNITYDGTFHSAEISNFDNLIFESNRSDGCLTRTIVELWTGCSNATVRYNIGKGALGKPDPMYTGGANPNSGIWATGFNDGGSTRLASDNSGNAYYYNLVYNLKKAGSSQLYGINHYGAAGKAYHNTLVGDFSSSGGVINGFGNLADNANVSLDLVNNLIVNTSTTSGNHVLESGTANIAVLTADGNNYCRDSNGATVAFQNTYAGTSYNTLPTGLNNWNALAAPPVTVGTDKVAAANCDANWRPAAGSALINGGVTIAGYQTRDLEGNPIYGTPTIGCYQFLPGFAKVSF
jgi:hypothetical protein